MRHPAVTVFWGCWVAMIIMSTLSSFMGAILPVFLTRRTAHWISAALFLGFGCLALRQGLLMRGDEINKEWEETQEEIEEDEETHELVDVEHGYPNVAPYPSRTAAAAAAATEPEPSSLSGAGVYIREGTRNLCGLLFSPVFSQAFVLSFLGEWGDRSQITTMALATTHRVGIVALGTSLAHMTCIFLAVVAGALFAARIQVRHLTIGGAVIFLLFGLNAAYDAMTTPETPESSTPGTPGALGALGAPGAWASSLAQSVPLPRFN